MALTAEDLQSIEGVVERVFDRKFDAAFDRKFPTAFDEAFDRKFPAAFDEAFDRKFEEKMNPIMDAVGERFDRLEHKVDGIADDLGALKVIVQDHTMEIARIKHRLP